MKSKTSDIDLERSKSKFIFNDYANFENSNNFNYEEMTKEDLTHLMELNQNEIK